MTVPDYFFGARSITTTASSLRNSAAHCAGDIRLGGIGIAIPPYGLLFLRLSEPPNALETASRRETSWGRPPEAREKQLRLPAPWRDQML